MNDEHTLLLGELKGKMDSLILMHQQSDKRLDRMEEQQELATKKLYTGGGVLAALVFLLELGPKFLFELVLGRGA